MFGNDFHSVWLLAKHVYRSYSTLAHHYPASLEASYLLHLIWLCYRGSLQDLRSQIPHASLCAGICYCGGGGVLCGTEEQLVLRPAMGGAHSMGQPHQCQ